jgi:methylthioribose-1-phosphate isomerase
VGLSTNCVASKPPDTLRWEGDITGALVLLDQTRLPSVVDYLVCRDVETVERAIRTLQVRGAPAIGVAAAYGLCLGLQSVLSADDSNFFDRLTKVAALLAASRPTAVNLFFAIDRLTARAIELRGRASPSAIAAALLESAQQLEAEDRAMCAAIGAAGAPLFTDGMGVLTHCNAGGLATCGIGTALAGPLVAHQQGRHLHVFVDETRPLLQGARLTAWELMQHGVPCTLICDSMAAQVMREGRVQAVVVGADRIAANGDTANKIGTYGVAVLAKVHGIPFYVAAPVTTFDLTLASGSSIPIEQRASQEVTHWREHQLGPAGVSVYNPAFDVTPAHLITALITDRGLIREVNESGIRRVLGVSTAP